ncbi:MAG: hypothetical protein BGN82_09305 [Alphaproteobacteria bacterium 65-7]|nr:MAG: hypothetical protein BGN82_09305 [Alphaproteobacteria bacterium 65-7]
MTKPEKSARGLVDTRILGRALLVGVMLEILLVLAGHYRPLLRVHYVLFGCMMIAGTAGLLYARDLARGYISGALGGLVIGAACGIAAVGLSNLLGDEPEQYIPYGVMICTLVGAIGGLFGQYAAWIREFIATLR